MDGSLTVTLNQGANARTTRNVYLFSISHFFWGGERRVCIVRSPCDNQKPYSSSFATGLGRRTGLLCVKDLFARVSS